MLTDRGIKSLGKFQDKSFCRRVQYKIKCDTNIAFRIIGLMLGAASVLGFSKSNHERLFVSICLLWSLVIGGAFQVSVEVFALKLNLLSITAKRVVANDFGVDIEHHLQQNLSFGLGTQGNGKRSDDPFTLYLLTI